MGGIDVFEFKALCQGVQPARHLIAALYRRGFTAAEAHAIIDWALRNGLLCAATSTGSATGAVPLA
jgi:hypothetical protein